MATDDDIERLLREVEGLDKPKAQSPAPQQSKQVEQHPSTDESSPRVEWAIKMALLGAILGLLIAFLPFVGWSAALGGAMGGAAAGYLSGPRK